MFKVYDDFLTYRPQLLSLVGMKGLRLETRKLIIFDGSNFRGVFQQSLDVIFLNSGVFFGQNYLIFWRCHKAMQILTDIAMYLLFIAYFEKSH